MEAGLKRILFISHSGGFAGAEKTLFNLVRTLDREKYVSEVVVPAEGPLMDRLKECGVRVHRRSITKWIPYYRKRSFIHLLLSLLKLPWKVWYLVRLIKRNRIDMVHTNTITMIDGALAAKLCKVPHIWHIHEILPETVHLKPYLPLRFTYGIVSRLSNAVVAVSDAVRKSILRVYPMPNIHVIHNGIPVLERYKNTGKEEQLNTELDFPCKGFCIGIVGNVQPIKGHDELIDALCLLAKRVADFHLLVIGDTSDEEYFHEIKLKIQNHGLSTHIHFLGYREDALRVLEAVDVVVIPSWIDSFPTVALESMALAKPLIATRSGGLEEIVVNEVTGFLVPPKDIQALAEKLLILARDKEMGMSMGTQGRKRVEELFSISRFVEAMGEVYSAVGA